jgi:integrase
MQLTEITLRKIINPGRYTDGQVKGLHLWVKTSGHRYWIFRYTFDGKRQGMSLGAYPEVGIKLARERAVAARNTINQGQNPIEEKKTYRALKTPVSALSFSCFADEYIKTMRPKWRNQKHGDQWFSTLNTYAHPIIGGMQLDEIDTNHVLQILNPIWLSKPETAARLRGRIERILSAAITRKMRPPHNPAIWKGHLENIMPSQAASDKHHSALPYSQITTFLNNLRERDTVSALALEFTILNASRTGEVLLGLKSEVDVDIWTIPGKRMKNGKKHQVPLGARSLEILMIAKSLDPDSEYLFSLKGKPLSSMAMLMTLRRLAPGITVHGFRSTFRDWVADETDHSPEVAEMALAHITGNKVEQAYRRGNMLARRRRLMEDWESYCLTGNWGNVVQLHERKVA